MAVSSEYEDLLMTHSSPLEVSCLLPVNVNFNGFHVQVINTQILAFSNHLLLLVEASDNENTLVKPTEDAELPGSKVGWHYYCIL